MNKLINLLISKGYKKFRFITNKKGFKKEYNPSIKDDTFSTMVDGGLDIRYEKDDDIWIFGLHEKGYPPTLIYPRPNIVFKIKSTEDLLLLRNLGYHKWKKYKIKDFVLNAQSKDVFMQRALKRYTAQEILDAINNNTTLII